MILDSKWMEDADARYIDLSHDIEAGMITYRRYPPVITVFLSREASRKNYTAGTEFHIGKIEMVANAGTYLDYLFRRYEYGMTSPGFRWNRWWTWKALWSPQLRTPRDCRFIPGITGAWQGSIDPERLGCILAHRCLLRRASVCDTRSRGAPSPGGAKLVGFDSFNIDGTADR